MAQTDTQTDRQMATLWLTWNLFVCHILQMTQHTPTKNYTDVTFLNFIFDRIICKFCQIVTIGIKETFKKYKKTYIKKKNYVCFWGIIRIILNHNNCFTIQLAGLGISWKWSLVDQRKSHKLLSISQYHILKVGFVLWEILRFRNLQF